MMTTNDDDEKPYIVAVKSSGGGFTPYSYHKNRPSALRRRLRLMEENPERTQLEVYRRIQSGVYKKATEEDV